MSRTGLGLRCAALTLLCLATGCGEPQPTEQATKSPETTKPASQDAGGPEVPSAASEIEAKSVSQDAGGSKPTQPAGAGLQDGPPPVDEAIHAVMDGIAANRPEVIWDAMPTTYQKRIEALVRSFGRSMDADVHGRIVGSLRKLEAILRNKKELILQNPQLVEAGFDPDRLSEHWEDFVALFSTVLDSELSDLEALQTIDVRNFLAETGGRLMQQISHLSATMPEDPYRTEVVDKLSDLEVEVISFNRQNATVLMGVAGEEPSEVDFRLVQGKWVPSQIASAFQSTAAQVGMLASMILPAYLKNNKDAVLQRFDDLDAALDRLNAAEDLDDFNVAVLDVVEQGSATIELFSDPSQMIAGARKKPATPNVFVTVIVLEELDASRREKLGEQLLSAVDDPDNSLVEPNSVDGRTSFRVSPVADLEAFVARLSFAAVSDMDEKQRTVIIKPQTREPLVAPTPQELAPVEAPR